MLLVGIMDKLDHLEHPEDLFLINGMKGLLDSFNILNQLNGAIWNGEDLQVSIKIDGSPSIITGYMDGRFFVSTKSFFNKNPKINYTIEDIFQNHKKQELGDVLCGCLEHLPKTIKYGIHQGDFLFDEKSKIINEKTLGRNYHTISFKPNIIEYYAEPLRPSYQKVKNAKIGIAFHTYYTKYGDKLLLQNIPGPVDRHQDVFVMPVEYDIKKNVYSLNELKEFSEYLSEAKHLSKYLDFDYIETYGNYIKQFINYTLRTDKERNWKNCSDFLKSKNIHEIREKNLYNILSVHYHIEQAKQVLLETFRDQTEFRSTIKEGFVVYLANNLVKLVDRNSFSKLNFRRDQ